LDEHSPPNLRLITGGDRAAILTVLGGLTFEELLEKVAMSKRGRPKTSRTEIFEEIAAQLERLEEWKRKVEEHPEHIKHDSLLIEQMRSELNGCVRKAIRAGLFNPPTLTQQIKPLLKQIAPLISTPWLWLWLGKEGRDIETLLLEDPNTLENRIKSFIDEWVRTHRVLGMRSELRKVKGKLAKGVKRPVNPEKKDKDAPLLDKILELRGIDESEPEGMIETVIEPRKHGRKIRHKVQDVDLLKSYGQKTVKKPRKASWNAILPIISEMLNPRGETLPATRQGFQKWLEKRFPREELSPERAHPGKKSLELDGRLCGPKQETDRKPTPQSLPKCFWCESTATHVAEMYGNPLKRYGCNEHLKTLNEWAEDYNRKLVKKLKKRRSDS
jgi:hypothetical protein